MMRILAALLMAACLTGCSSQADRFRGTGQAEDIRPPDSVSRSAELCRTAGKTC